MKPILFGSRWLGFASRCGLLLLLALVGGCGPGYGKVSGRVVYNGQPVPGGRVLFRPADPRQNSVSAEIDEQGHYEAVLPAGEVKVSVDNRELEPHATHWTGGGLPPGLPPDLLKNIPKNTPEQSPPASRDNAPSKLPGKYRRIPNKYYQVETSGLSFTVKGGAQEENLELKDR
jgi:hypothetical protein